MKRISFAQSYLIVWIFRLCKLYSYSRPFTYQLTLSVDERNISLYALAKSSEPRWDKTQTATMAAKLEALLLQPEYAGLVEQAFALCDALEGALLNDLSTFSATVNAAAQKIAKKPMDKITDFEFTRFMPEPLEMVFNALMTVVILDQGV